MKVCSRCKIEKPLGDYYKYKRSKDGYLAYCKECDKKAKAADYLKNKDAYIARANSWAAANREKTREFKRNWKRNNPDALRQYKHKRRAKESVDHFTGNEWADLLAFYQGKCLACGTTENISADHVIPLALGGSNGIDNIQPLCRECNCKKGIKETDYREVRYSKQDDSLRDGGEEARRHDAAV